MGNLFKTYKNPKYMNLSGIPIVYVKPQITASYKNYETSHQLHNDFALWYVNKIRLISKTINYTDKIKIKMQQLINITTYHQLLLFITTDKNCKIDLCDSNQKKLNEEIPCNWGYGVEQWNKDYTIINKYVNKTIIGKTQLEYDLLDIECDRYILLLISTKLCVGSTISKLKLIVDECDHFLLNHNNPESIKINQPVYDIIKNDESCKLILHSMTNINKNDLINDNKTRQFMFDINNENLSIDNRIASVSQLRLFRDNINKKDKLLLLLFTIKKLSSYIIWSQIFVNAINNSNIIISCNDVKFKFNDIKFNTQLCNNVLNHNINNDIYTLKFKFENNITTYQVHSFAINYDYFNCVMNNSYIESREKIFSLIINHIKTGEDFINYIYLKKLVIDCDVIHRLQSLIILGNYLTIVNLVDECKNMLELITMSDIFI